MSTTGIPAGSRGPRAKLIALLLDTYGVLERFLAVARSEHPLIPTHSAGMIAEILFTRTNDVNLRVAASRAAIDIFRLSQVTPRIPKLMGLLELDEEDCRIRMNCGLLLLKTSVCDNARIIAAMRKCAGGSPWTAALFKALVAGEEDTKTADSPADRLLAIASSGSNEERAAALFLLQWHTCSTKGFELALGLCGSDCPLLRIAAARLAMHSAVQLTRTIGNQLAKALVPFADGGSSDLRLLLTDLTRLFSPFAPQIKGLPELLQADGDERVKQRMTESDGDPRTMEFPM